LFTENAQLYKECAALERIRGFTKALHYGAFSHMQSSLRK